MTAYRLGVDIGGTFTDIVILAPDGTIYSKKILSTPDDYSRAIEDGVVQLLGETGISADEITEFAHGTTVATNALIERRGVKVALITTRGFRDVLELGRFRSPRLYDFTFRKPDPLVERRLRFEVEERTKRQGRNPGCRRYEGPRPACRKARRGRGPGGGHLLHQLLRQSGE